MSISNYQQLQASLNRWLHRSDMAIVIPDLIVLAETRFNRNLRVRQMEKRLSAPITSETVALPADWLEFVGAPMDGETQFNYVARDQWDLNVGARNFGSFYTIIGDSILVGSDFAAPVNLRFDYYAKIPALSDEAPTNWLLLDGPDLYMYGALLEAEPYIKNDSRMETWRALLQVALTDLQASNDRAKYSGGTLELRAPQP